MSGKRLRRQGGGLGYVSSGPMGCSGTERWLEKPVTKQKWSGSSSTATLSHWRGTAWGGCGPRVQTVTDGQNEASGSC